ncbi:hypothetical protein ACLMJK_002235 [Lecanora helva]
MYIINLSGLLVIAATAAAQTWTSCNPLNQTNCPGDTALGVANATFDFTKATARDDVWNTTAGSITYGQDGAEFTIASEGDSPTIQSKFYILFGEVEVWLKAAPGQGVVSTVVLESDDLDEIDLEFVGSNTTHAENNYYGKGNTTDEAARAKWYPVGSSPMDDFHNYTTRWTNGTLEWYIDGNVVRTLSYADANGGNSYPQSPMNVRIGVWAGGDKKNNNYTVQWAGGQIDYDKGPYTMVVRNVRVADYSTGSVYTYGDQTGDYKSIKIASGNSTFANILSKPPPKSLKQEWSGLSSGAKIAIAAGIGAFIAFILGAWVFCCFKQRRAGKKEGALVDAAYEKDTAELMAYRAEMGKTQVKVSEYEVGRGRF